MNRDDKGRFCKPARPINRPTLVTIAKIEACRAGAELIDHGDQVTLRSLDGEINERLELRDACAVLGMMRGVYCSPHVLAAGGVKIVRS